MLVLGRHEVEELLDLRSDSCVLAIPGTVEGRASRDAITLYKSVGVAVQDLVAAALVLAAARDRGSGQAIELEEISV